MARASSAQHALLHNEVTQSVMLIFSEKEGMMYAHVGGDKLWAVNLCGFICFF